MSVKEVAMVDAETVGIGGFEKLEVLKCFRDEFKKLRKRVEEKRSKSTPSPYNGSDSNCQDDSVGSARAPLLGRFGVHRKSGDKGGAKVDSWSIDLDNKSGYVDGILGTFSSVENRIASTSPPYWDSDDDDDCGVSEGEDFDRFESVWRCFAVIFVFMSLVKSAIEVQAQQTQNPINDAPYKFCFKVEDDGCIEAPHMHKAYKKRRALGFRALSLGAPRKGDGF
ncbi:hypothetical protein Tco_0639733 [Tanacetum coccineum]